MEILVKKSSFVCPSKATPKHCLWNSDLDLYVLTTHVPTVYFYRRPSDCSNFFDVALLKDALSNILVPFYPVAGRLGRDANGRLEILCNAEGVLFVEAQTTCCIDDLGDVAPGPKLLQFIPIPQIDYNNAADLSSHPLLVVQLTNFRCGGVCLGIGLHHALADGTSAIHFLNTWADMTRGLPISIPPFIDRTIIRDRIPPSPTFEHIEYQPPPSMIQDLLSSPRPATSVTLELSPDQINTLKAKVNRDNGINYSTFEVLSAHIWRCTCKARGLSDDQASKLRIPTNGRSRLNPPLPSGYFGNVIFCAAPIVLAGEITSKPLINTVERIREAINRMDDEYLRSALSYLANQDDLVVVKPGAHTDKCPNLRITSWTGMTVYDADFGWGRPMFTGLAGTSHEGSACVLSAGPSNDGSLKVIICLEIHHAQLFQKCFYDF